MWGRHFELLTDHAFMRWLNNYKICNGMFARWLASLQDMTIIPSIERGSYTLTLTDCPDTTPARIHSVLDRSPTWWEAIKICHPSKNSTTHTHKHTHTHTLTQTETNTKRIGYRNVRMDDRSTNSTETPDRDSYSGVPLCLSGSETYTEATHRERH